MNFNTAFDKLMVHEGGYSDNSSDPGGKTRYGITEDVARASGYLGEMSELPLTLAKVIYLRSYWSPCRCEDLPDAVKFDVFDGAVNSGNGQSIKWLQRAIGVADDGVIGKLTIDAAQNIPGGIVAARYNGQRLMFMTRLKVWNAFSQGWAARIAKNLMEA
jgi:lysozyme family protein